MPFLRWLRTLGRVVVGGALVGLVGGAALGLGAFGLFPFGTTSFALFGPKSQVFPATFRLQFGELPATKRRQVRRPFVTKFAVPSPFAAWGFSFLLYARRGWGAPTSPLRRAKLCAPETTPLRRAKVPRRPNFAASPCESPAKPLGFRASPWKSPPNRPVFHFAVRKSTGSPRFSLRRGKVDPAARLFRFAMPPLRRGEGRGPPISRLPLEETAAPCRKIVRVNKTIFGGSVS